MDPLGQGQWYTHCSLQAVLYRCLPSDGPTLRLIHVTGQNNIIEQKRTMLVNLTLDDVKFMRVIIMASLRKTSYNNAKRFSNLIKLLKG